MSSNTSTPNAIPLQANVLFHPNREMLMDYDEWSKPLIKELYHLSDYVVRVETPASDTQPAVIRYGIMLPVHEEDFSKTSTTPNNTNSNDGKASNDTKNHHRSPETYMVEIPVDEITPLDRQKAQEELIKTYLQAMRTRFQRFYNDTINGKIAFSKDKNSKPADDIDAFNRLQAQRHTPEGLWHLTQKFRQNALHSDELIEHEQGNALKKNRLISFREWLFKHRLGLQNIESQHLHNYALCLQQNQEYLISVDWLDSYTMYVEPSNVSSLPIEKHESGDPRLFYPFQNFMQKPEFCTQVIIDDDILKRRIERKKSIAIKPTNYALFGFYTRILNLIAELQTQNYENTKTYHQYVQNLTVIHDLLDQKGPLHQIPQHKIAEALKAELRSDWDGKLPDPDDHQDRYLREFHEGLLDIKRANELFSQVIVGHSTGSRQVNFDNTQQLKQLAYALYMSFWVASSMPNSIVKQCYEQQWCFNRDELGINHLVHHLSNTLRYFDEADKFYHDYLIPHLYEHPNLEDTYQQVRSYATAGNQVISKAGEDWGNILYRHANIVVGIWGRFYEIREEKLVQGLPDADAIEGKITTYQEARQTQADQSPKKLKRSPYMPDKQVTKLVNYLLGGGHLEHLHKIQHALLEYTQARLSNVEIDKLSAAETKQLSGELNLERNRLTAEVIPESRIPSITNSSNAIVTSINFMLVIFVSHNFVVTTKDGEVETETALRIFSTILGLASDIGNTYAYSVHRVLPTAFRSEAMKTAAKGLSKQSGVRLSLILGRLQLVAGGAGGIIGAVWSGIDAIRNFRKGNSSDGLLDVATAAGSILSVSALFAIGVLAPLGIMISVIGFAAVLIAQVLKYTRFFSSKTEDYCRFLYTENIENGGTDMLSEWMGQYTSTIPSVLQNYAELNLSSSFEKDQALLIRVDNFIKSSKTYNILKEDEETKNHDNNKKSTINSSLNNVLV